MAGRDKEKDAAYRQAKLLYGGREPEVTEGQGLPEIWKPDKKGDCIFGVLVSISEGDIEGKPVTNYILEIGEKKIPMQLPIHTTLMRMVSKSAVGEMIFARYKGGTKGKKGQLFFDYDVTIYADPKKSETPF